MKLYLPKEYNFTYNIFYKSETPMGLFKKKVYLTQSQEQRFLALSQYYHLPFDHLVNRVLEQFLDKELKAIRPEPPRAPNEVQRGHPRIPPMPSLPPATRIITEGEK